MDALPEHGSPRAARILEATHDLVLRRGVKAVTIADVAARAGVGKGTPYLYWANKTDLVLELLVRDVVTIAERYLAELGRDPAAVLPERICVGGLQNAPDHPLVDALRRRDAEVLGSVLHDPRAETLAELVGPRVLADRLLPAWRRHGLARDGVDVEMQAFAVEALLEGVAVLRSRAERLGRPSPAELEEIDEATVVALRAVLAVGEPTQEQVVVAAQDARRIIGALRASAVDLLAPSPG